MPQGLLLHNQIRIDNLCVAGRPSLSLSMSCLFLLHLLSPCVAALRSDGSDLDVEARATSRPTFRLKHLRKPQKHTQTYLNPRLAGLVVHPM